VRTSAGGQYRADLVVGADGLGSLVRRSAGLERRAARMLAGSTRILVPRDPSDPHEGSIEMWRGHKRIMVVPVGNTITYYCATCREDDVRGAASPFDLAYWSDAFPEFRSLFVRTDPANTVHHPHGSIRVHGWSRGRIAILGDAVHGQPPNLGQGAGLAIANGGALADYLETSDIVTGLRQWEQDCRPITEHVQRWSENWDYFVHGWPLALEGMRSSVIWALANFPPTRRHWGKLYRGLPVGIAAAMSNPPSSSALRS
jgi:2-polyprenyl-6-methoxyphenol hydroxylase-like FAD-dependent oxidoreductase